MKKSLLRGAALVLLLALLSGCARLVPGGSTAEPDQTDTVASSETPDPTPSETADETPDTPVGVVTIESDHYTYSSDYIDVTIDVPQVTGLSNSMVQDSINAIFNDVMTSVQKEVKLSEAESKQYADEGQTVGPYEMYISYSTPYNHHGILSIVMSDYRYLGGAHGGEFRNAYTFDLKTGRELGLGDLMEKDGEYRAYINKSIKNEIVNRVESGELYEIAAFEDIGDDPAFYLTQDAIVFYFRQYEYFPYASGIQEFPITYAELAVILKKEYASLNMTPVILDNIADNIMSVGDVGQVALTGNPTTGYSWHYTISDSNILELASSHYQSDAIEGVVGAGGTYKWDFRALKPGTATIAFKYYRVWLGESDAAPEDNVVFTVIVK